jgi:GNAT superfamily N-acetyltransferase
VRAKYPANLTLTEPVEDDTRYIKATWLRSYRESEGCVEIPDSAYFPYQRARIDRILARDPLVIVARDRENPVYVFGYGVFERVGDKLVAHWVYVRKVEKRQGIAKLLLATALKRIGDGARRLVMTHRTYAEPKAREMGFEFIKLESLYASETGEEASRCA